MMIPRRLDTVYPILSFLLVAHRVLCFPPSVTDFVTSPRRKNPVIFSQKAFYFWTFSEKAFSFLDFLPKSVFFFGFSPKKRFILDFLPKSVLSSKLLHWVQKRRRNAGVSLNYQGLVSLRYSVIKFKKAAGFTPMALQNSSEEILPCCHWSYSGAHFPVKS